MTNQREEKFLPTSQTGSQSPALSSMPFSEPITKFEAQLRKNVTASSKGYVRSEKLHTVVNQLRVGYRALNELAILPFTIKNAIGWMLHSPIDTYILPHGVQAIPTYLEFLLPIGTYVKKEYSSPNIEIV